MRSTNQPLINLNTADESLLVSKLTISPRLAKRIIALRPYLSVEQLSQVWGLDAETLLRIQSMITIDPDVTNEQVQVDLPITPIKNSQIDTKPPQKEPAPAPKETSKTDKILDLILVLAFIIAAFLRFTGQNWDQNRHQHPDERYLSMVSSGIHTVGSIKEYFDTANSTMNPMSNGSYTYGMLPLFATRIVAEWVNLTSFDQITLVGRTLSAVFDLLALWMIFVLGRFLYNKKTGVLAAALYAAAVFPIQMSHYFTVDSFCTVFVILAIYLSLKALKITDPQYRLCWKKLGYFALFGLVVGMAGACKVNAVTIFVSILIASLVHLISIWKKPCFGNQISILIVGVLLSLVGAFIGFRVFQPYAFSGTGFLGSALNQRWLDVIKEVTNQVAGFSEWPPNHHWTDRPLSYAWVNMVVWGLGIPLGIAGWAGWLWSAWRMWKGQWRSHILPFAWVLLYFVWQNMQFWRYMRYFLIIYPFIVLFAAWALIELLEKFGESRKQLDFANIKSKFALFNFRSSWKRLVSLLIICLVLISTYAYAFGFARIYTRTITRVAASNWMIKNIQGPLNLKVDTAGGQDSYPISIINRWNLEPGDAPKIELQMTRDGTVNSVTSTNIEKIGAYIYFRVCKEENGEGILTESRLPVMDDDPINSLEMKFGSITLSKDTTYYFKYKITSSSDYSLSDVNLQSDISDSPFIPLNLSLAEQPAGVLEGTIELHPTEDIKLNRLKINQFNQVFKPTQSTLKISLLKDGDEANPLGSAIQTLDFTQPGMSLSPVFDLPDISVERNSTVQVKYEIVEGSPLHLTAEPFAIETSWDDALPLVVGNYDPLGGIYTPYNLELYEPDTPEKREKMIEILENTNYLVLSSNRGYDAMPRLPNRYPLTTRYYQELFDCDCVGDELENKAYSLEAPFTSPLGFELVATFVSNPSIGPIRLNDQSADESFTVYDHPKVFIFKKTSDFSIEHVKEILYSVNLDNVLFQSPMSYTKAPGALELDSDRLTAQRTGGTWSDLFNRLALVNTNQLFAAIIWYLLLFVLGLLVFPLVFTVFSGLPDRGYPLARMAALLLTAWLAWMLGSLKILTFTRWSILLGVLIIGVVSIYFGIKHKASLVDYFKNQWNHILVTEVFFAILFVGMLLFRLYNPDLWHPWRGGEKPMDFAFFNAILKANFFPPENPWFAGHYLNYYYFGYVVAAIPTKITGILPSIAYNLILPGWYAMTGIGVFCIGYNLVLGLSHKGGLYRVSPFDDWNGHEKSAKRKAYFAAVFAMLAVILFGNLYEVKIAAKNMPEIIDQWYEDNPDYQSRGTIYAALQALSNPNDLPGSNSLWYFDASRPILNGKDDTPIAEFPYFTYLYGDMHPHMLTMLFYALAFAWMLSNLLHPISAMHWPERILSLVVAAILFGSFSASHTWDFYPFLGLANLVLIWSVWKTKTGDTKSTLTKIAGFVAAFSGLCLLVFLPFSHWFKTAYASVELWKGTKTPLVDYLVVYGLSLFIIVTLLIKESAADLRSAYRAWPGYTWATRIIVLVGLAALYLVSNLLWQANYQVLVLGLFLSVGLVYQVFFKRGQSPLNRITWVLYSVGLLLTLLVEVVVLKGDTGRSNMVFRMYIEAWFYIGISASLALIILFAGMKKWPLWVSVPWSLILTALVIGSLSYPYLATEKKIADRWPDISQPPVTLDGMAFMLGEADQSAPANYDDDGKLINLAEDYAAIQYMQDNIKGSPVIVEGNTTEYRWGSRFSVHTGLPSVIGWSWHTRQHNSLLDGGWFTKKIDTLNDFYNSTDPIAALDYLAENEVGYIILGDLERAYYSAEGLAKFQQMSDQGSLRIVFGNESENTTTIYEVINPGN